MTGDAGDHPPGSRVRHLGTDRMGELALALVAQGADLQAVPFQHGHIAAAVCKVAIRAFINAAMSPRAVPVFVNGRAVTGSADLFFPGPQQILFIAGMRGVAVDAAVAVPARQMAVGGLHLFKDPGVTLLASLYADHARGLIMARITALLIRLMQNVADQGRPLAAMRIVTGEAIAQGAGIVGVLGLQPLCLVAGAAQFIRGLGQEHGAVGIVRLVTGPAFTVQIGCMGIFVFFLKNLGIFIFLLESVMALQTSALDIFGDQPLLGCSMRLMAVRTLIAIDGLMDDACLEGFGLFLVTGVAELALLKQQQPFVAGYMGIVAYTALAGFHRLVHHLVLKLGLIVTGKTRLVPGG
ncbi:MAG: hypothetical protein LUQ69_10600 [Methanoregulaceae archaeon]|nr:hypothetical protein [Methanoregulaceae archaeon]